MTHICVHTGTHTLQETQRKSKTPQVSRKREKELEGKVADTHAHTQAHIHTEQE